MKPGKKSFLPKFTMWPVRRERKGPLPESIGMRQASEHIIVLFVVTTSSGLMQSLRVIVDGRVFSRRSAKQVSYTKKTILIIWKGSRYYAGVVGHILAIYLMMVPSQLASDTA